MRVVRRCSWTVSFTCDRPASISVTFDSRQRSPTVLSGAALVSGYRLYERVQHACSSHGPVLVVLNYAVGPCAAAAAAATTAPAKRNLLSSLHTMCREARGSNNHQEESGRPSQASAYHTTGEHHTAGYISFYYMLMLTQA